MRWEQALTSTPTWRAGIVTACAAVMVLGTLAGFGLLGTRVEAVITRLLGVLLAALAAQYVIDGLKAVFL